MSRTQSAPPHKQPVTTPKFLMDIPDAAASMCTTIFAIRQLCRSGMLRYSRSSCRNYVLPVLRTRFRRSLVPCGMQSEGEYCSDHMNVAHLSRLVKSRQIRGRCAL
jgi:hypothetical protein